MRSIVRYLCVGILSLSLAACGKSDEQKAQDTANDLVTEHNQLADSINSMGTPSSSWSDESLNDYEAKLNRLESVESQLDSMNGQNGVSTWGGGNSYKITLKRQMLADARSEKAQQKEKEAQQKTASDRVEEYNTLARQVNDMGMPLASWSDDKLNDYEAKLNRFATLDSETRGMAGIDMVGDNSAVISRCRENLANARTEKAKQPKNEQAA